MPIELDEPTITIPKYPADEVREVLTGELITSVKDLSDIQGIVLPTEKKELVVKTLHIDSHTLVEILCSLDPVVGFEVGQEALRPGGYDSIEEAVIDVTARLEKLWAEHYAKKVKA
ncbi:hypothetical protein [Neorhizobium alkalisoli]|uniref:Uncharacterized protein n=1 Tax=Neorhizobium alkalisoli TaxID=528178 RepID=A0A561QB41_9HYPH|nr:hypothetical protein [Neorhizobium alkalisoli]TWF47582.1 hypothetical protein FHW37_11185 [Neorhizobium alkalisoli]